MHYIIRNLIIAIPTGVWSYFVAIIAIEMESTYHRGYGNWDADALATLLLIMVFVCPILIAAIIDHFYSLIDSHRMVKVKETPKLPYPKFPLVIEKPVEVEKIVEKIVEKPVPSEQGNIVINIDGKKITMNDSVYTE